MNALLELDAWRTLLTRLPEPALILRGDGLILVANSALARLLKRPAPELVNLSLTEVVTTPPANVLRYMAACARTAEMLPGAMTVRVQDGLSLACRCEGAALRPWSPSSAAIVLMRLKPRQSPDNHFLALNQRIAVLTQELYERRRTLDVQQQLLDDIHRSNAELQQFAYVASHDLQEPLRTVANFVQLLARRLHDRLGEDEREWMNFVVDGARRMKTLIDALLAYARIEAQARPHGPVDSEALLLDTLGILQATITERHASITHDALPTVWGDAVRLGQVWQNLLGNALKFVGTAPPEIHIAARRERRQWVFSVRDNGIGIDPQHQGQIFQIFRRLHPSSPGAGIGLAICKKIIEQHGGRIWVESQVGQGTAFFFTLPVQERP